MARSEVSDSPDQSSFHIQRSRVGDKSRYLSDCVRCECNRELLVVVRNRILADLGENAAGNILWDRTRTSQPQPPLMPSRNLAVVRAEMPRTVVPHEMDHHLLTTGCASAAARPNPEHRMLSTLSCRHAPPQDSLCNNSRLACVFAHQFLRLSPQDLWAW